MIKTAPMAVEYYVLGDCSIATSQGEVITDSRIQQFSEDNIKQLEANPKDRQSVFQGTRKKMNTPAGYWIGSVDGAGIDHGIQGIFPHLDPIALYTDGLKDLLANHGLGEGFIFNQVEKIDSLLKLDHQQFFNKEALYGKKDDTTLLVLKP